MGNLRSSSATLLVLTLGLLLLCVLAWWAYSGDEGEGRALELDAEPGVELVDVPGVVREPVEPHEEVASDETTHPTKFERERPPRPTAETGSSRVSEGAVAEEDPGPPPNPHPPWLLDATIIPAGIGFHDNFPTSLALDGNTLVAGAAHSANPGEVLVYRRENEKWKEEVRLRAGDETGHDWFGVAVAISGDTLVIGAPGGLVEPGFAYSVPGDAGERKATRLGAAHVFTRTGTEWTRIARLTSDSKDENEKFGGAVCISDDTILIGAGHEWDWERSETHVHVFVREGAEWKRQARLQAGDAAGESFWFGYSVAISGTRAVVGSRCYEGTSLAYVFQREGGTWRELCRLGAQGPWSHWGVGWSVAMYGEEIAVSVQHVDVERRVLLYHIDREACLNVDQLFPPLDLPPENAENPEVAMHGDTLLVCWDGLGPVPPEGVDVYARENLVWKLQSTLVAPPGYAADFGKSMALSKDWIAIGTDWYHLATRERVYGAVRLYRRED